MRWTPHSAHRFKHIERGDRVLLEIASRMIGAEADVCVRGQVKHGLGATHGIDESRTILRISLNQRKSGPRPRSQPGKSWRSNT